MKSKVVFLIFLLVILLIPVVQAEDALDWYTKGQYAIGLGNYADALTYFDNALALDKNYGLALSGKAVAFNSMGKYTDAIASADAAIAIKPADQTALHARACTDCSGLGQYADSVTAYDRLFSTGYVRSDAYCNQGYAYLNLNKSDDAVANYEKCLKIDPKNLDGWNQKGLALMNLGRFQDALDAYDQATVVSAKNAEVWNNKGLAYAALGKYQDALQCFNKALGIKPVSPMLRRTRDSMMGKAQFVTISGTITPTVTISRIGTFFTTVTPSQLITQVTTNTPPTGEIPVTTNTPAKKTTYSPISLFTVIASVCAGFGAMLWVNRNKK